MGQLGWLRSMTILFRTSLPGGKRDSVGGVGVCESGQVMVSIFSDGWVGG